MGFDAQDKEIVRLLTKLRQADGKYPSDLLTARRQSYLKRMGEVSLGIGAGLKIKSALEAAKTPSFSSATSTILESALLVAIVAETGAVAYLYRDKLAGFFKNSKREANVQEVTPSSNTEPVIQGVNPSIAVGSTLPSVTLSVSPTEPEVTSTPMPGVVDKNANSTAGANSTPVPNGNNGNHYGQTPKPQRTKEPKNQNIPVPKDNSKLTRTK